MYPDFNRLPEGLPEHGVDVAGIARELKLARCPTPQLKAPAPSLIMHPAELARVIAAAFVGVRADSDAFTRRVEVDLKGIILSALGLPRRAACFLTGSGTESILLGLFAARRLTRNTTARPRLIGPKTLHHSVRKCAGLLDIAFAPVDVDSEQRADPAALRETIDDRTIAVAASAPSWAAGAWDPLAQIAALAIERELCFHVDACIGGFLLPFLGRETPATLTSTSGIASIAIDLHKFGYAPFSLSALCFPSDADCDFAEFKPLAGEPGSGSSFTLASDRPFWPIAAAWAIAKMLGRSGYECLAKQMLARRDSICDVAVERGLTVAADESSPIVRLLSTPFMSLESLGERLTLAQIPHVLCPIPGHARLRVDPLIEDAVFATLLQRLASI